MSLENQIGRATLDMGEIIKANVIGALARGRSEGAFSVSDADLTKIANIISANIDSSVMNGCDMLIRVIKQPNK
jgi:hypothetical protein